MYIICRSYNAFYTDAHVIDDRTIGRQHNFHGARVSSAIKITSPFPSLPGRVKPGAVLPGLLVGRSILPADTHTHTHKHTCHSIHEILDKCYESIDLSKLHLQPHLPLSHPVVSHRGWKCNHLAQVCDLSSPKYSCQPLPPGPELAILAAWRSDCSSSQANQAAAQHSLAASTRSAAEVRRKSDRALACTLLRTVQVLRDEVSVLQARP